MVAGIFVLLLFDHPPEIPNGNGINADEDVYVSKSSVSVWELI